MPRLLNVTNILQYSIYNFTEHAVNFADIIVAGGKDSMSQAELYIPGHIRWGLGGTKDEKWRFMPKGHGALSMRGIPVYNRTQRARIMSRPVETFRELKRRGARYGLETTCGGGDHAIAAVLER